MNIEIRITEDSSEEELDKMAKRKGFNSVVEMLTTELTKQIKYYRIFNEKEIEDKRIIKDKIIVNEKDVVDKIITGGNRKWQ